MNLAAFSAAVSSAVSSSDSNASSSSRSRSSLLSTSTSSSLSSTFSDLSVSSFASAPSPPRSTSGAKTHAFFASPFSSTRSPSPVPLTSPASSPSITDHFFAAPKEPPLQPPKSKASTNTSRIHVSRIFPSRYTSTDSSHNAKPDFIHIDTSTEHHDPTSNFLLPLPSPSFERTHSASSSISSASSSRIVDPNDRLPTPPPPPEQLDEEEPTPRPANLEPPLSNFERGMHLEVPQSNDDDDEPRSGSVITSHNTPHLLRERNTPTPTGASSRIVDPTLRLIRPLGQGAFSAVWLAEDLSPVPLALASKKSVRDLRRQASLNKKSGEEARANLMDESQAEMGLRGMLSNDNERKSLSRNSSIASRRSIRSPTASTFHQQQLALEGTLSRNSSLNKFKERVRGTRPAFRIKGRKRSGDNEVYLDERDGEMGVLLREEGIGLGGSLSRKGEEMKGRVVAVKMTPKRAPGSSLLEEERTRVGFVREVEVLRHISHPNITPLLAHLSTATHHVLVLPYLQGGDLLGLVNNDVAWGKLAESVLQRIWCELVKAVGWMHGVGLVHRDIKLENILLTTPAYNALTPESPIPTLSSLPIPPLPLIMLTDFGLSRFIELDEDGDAELLSTRCGSEAYAAPELVMGGASEKKSRRGVYDARETDAWACGVVLYALVGRRLPFGEGVGMGDGKEKIGGERERMGNSMVERRQWLMRIARGEWEWPGGEPEQRDLGEEEELVGERLVESQGARRMVSRLLVRDPRKRSRVGELWDDEWMWTSGCIVPEKARNRQEQDSVRLLPIEPYGDEASDVLFASPVDEEGTSVPILRLHDGEGDDHMDVDDGEWIFDEEEGEEGITDEPEEEEEGLLLDQEGIDNIARQEVV